MLWGVYIFCYIEITMLIFVCCICLFRDFCCPARGSTTRYRTISRNPIQINEEINIPKTRRSKHKVIIACPGRLCVCMYKCISISMQVGMYVCMHVCMYVSNFFIIHVNISTYIDICKYIYIRIIEEYSIHYLSIHNLSFIKKTIKRQKVVECTHSGSRLLRFLFLILLLIYFSLFVCI